MNIFNNELFLFNKSWFTLNIKQNIYFPFEIFSFFLLLNSVLLLYYCYLFLIFFSLSCFLLVVGFNDNWFKLIQFKHIQSMELKYTNKMVCWIKCEKKNRKNFKEKNIFSLKKIYLIKKIQKNSKKKRLIYCCYLNILYKFFIFFLENRQEDKWYL